MQKKATPDEKAEERWAFYRLADQDWEHADFALDHVNNSTDEFIRHSLIMDAVVSYMRPFCKCKGVHQSYFRNRTFVPKEYRDLHEKMLFFRHQVFAHTDITARRPKVARFKTTDGFRYGMGFQGLRASEFVPLIPRIKKLLQSIREKNANDILEIQEKYFEKIPYNPSRK